MKITNLYQPPVHAVGLVVGIKAGTVFSATCIGAMNIPGPRELYLRIGGGFVMLSGNYLSYSVTDSSFAYGYIEHPDSELIVRC